MSPRLFIESDGSSFTIMCADGRMSPMPAGPRLFRQQPWPEVKFDHPDFESAKADETKLRAYLARLEPRS